MELQKKNNQVFNKCRVKIDVNLKNRAYVINKFFSFVYRVKHT